MSSSGFSRDGVYCSASTASAERLAKIEKVSKLTQLFLVLAGCLLLETAVLKSLNAE